jgi:glycosyltransferase involved in cell wall biosynthesis
MKIAILLPYKENFSFKYPGSVSIFLKDTLKLSKYHNDTFVFGDTNFKQKISKNYINLNFKKKFFRSKSYSYLSSFLDKTLNKNFDIIEVHNRPKYIPFLTKHFTNLVLYFHNDPISMEGSKKVSERLYLLEKLKFIIFNSKWTKKKFLDNLSFPSKFKKKLLIIRQSTSKIKIDLSNKKNLITFIGKLNLSKGYDLFGESIIKILNKYQNWNAVVFGDENREKYNFKHKNLKIIGFKKHDYIMNYLKKVSICVVCSRWEEPFGRVALEASSTGCATIITNKGGLPEAVTDSIKINNLNKNSVYNAINKLILNKKLRIKLQKNSIKNFYLTNELAAKKIDLYRNKVFKT